MWCEVQETSIIHGRKRHESLSLNKCTASFTLRTAMGITVEQWRKGLRGRVKAACKDRDLAWKKWSTSITDAKNPAKRTSPKSDFFLIPVTTAHDHMPITPCTMLSEMARSQSLCWIMGNRRSLSATRQKIPRPMLEMRDSVLQHGGCPVSKDPQTLDWGSALPPRRGSAPNNCFRTFEKQISPLKSGEMSQWLKHLCCSFRGPETPITGCSPLPMIPGLGDLILSSGLYGWIRICTHMVHMHIQINT